MTDSRRKEDCCKLEEISRLLRTCSGFCSLLRVNNRAVSGRPGHAACPSFGFSSLTWAPTFHAFATAKFQESARLPSASEPLYLLFLPAYSLLNFFPSLFTCYFLPSFSYLLVKASLTTFCKTALPASATSHEHALKSPPRLYFPIALSFSNVSCNLLLNFVYCLFPTIDLFLVPRIMAGYRRHLLNCLNEGVDESSSGKFDYKSTRRGSLGENEGWTLNSIVTRGTVVGGLEKCRHCSCNSECAHKVYELKIFFCLVVSPIWWVIHCLPFDTVGPRHVCI